MAIQSLPVNPPSYFKDHRKAKNPYRSRYGEGWVDKLKSSTAMSKFYCITDLIRFVMNEADKMMKGSLHEDDLYIVHDALVLMTAKETINWMKKKGTYIVGCLPLMECRMVLLTPAILLVIALSSCRYIKASIEISCNTCVFIVF